MWKWTGVPWWACLVVAVTGVSIGFSVGVGSTGLHVGVEEAQGVFSESQEVGGSRRSLQETSNEEDGIYLCPADTESVVTVGVGGSSVMLGRSSNTTLCILARVTQMDPSDNDEVDEEVRIVGRSYEARPWQAVAGEYVRLVYECVGDFCSVDLPPLSNDGKQVYVLGTFRNRLKSREVVARFLEQTTFGPTTAELNNWTMFEGREDLEYTFVEWLKEQIYEVPPTSHRAFWRHRSNTRVLGTEIVAPTRRVCDRYSRWRTVAFSISDAFKTLEVSSLADDGSDRPPYLLSVDGQARTVVNGFRSGPTAPYVFDGPGRYQICGNIDHVVRGSFFVRGFELPDGPCGRLREGNPPVSRVHLFTPRTSILIFPAAIADGGELLLDPTVPGRGEYLVTAEIDDDLCDNFNVPGMDGPAAFAQLQDTGEYLIIDPHLQLSNNTVDSPVSDGGGAFVKLSNEVSLCSNVPRSLFNDGHCRLSFDVAACAATPVVQTSLTLDKESVRKLHELSGHLVYVVEGLRVEDCEVVRSPCVPGSRSRWRRIPTTPATRSSCVSSFDLDPTTIQALQTLLRSSLDPNPEIADVLFPTARLQCHENDANAKGMKILVQNQCWQHVHPQLLNVYDVTPYLTSFMMSQPNATMISLSALQEPASLGMHNFLFPSDQNMTVWEKTVGMFDLVGRYMDDTTTDFLSEELANLAVQEAFGSDSGSGSRFRPQGVGVMVCGSPNELANDVTQLVPDFSVAVGSRSIIFPKRDRIAQRKSVWSTLALSAQDQFRQRAAWALSQVFVISKNHIFQLQSSENFLAYYDLFVTHAFGNYRDLVREVSFSPMMGEMLTFIRSRSTEFYWKTFQKLAFADENYAREVMQLFTIGTVQLNRDGTPALDENGKLILSYTNDDIVSYSRAWTGLDYHPRRGNLEIFRNSTRSYIDPMRIRPRWRDRFPKTDLKAGFLGDRVPLCVDLPPKHFLQRGARYRLLGSWPIPDLQKDPDSWIFDDSIKRVKLKQGSALQRALCGKAAKNGGCTPAVDMVLKSDKKCSGDECDVDTLRVVEAASGVFYEYVRLPCVELSVFDGVTIADARRSTQMCLDKRLERASEACCPKDDEDRRAFRGCTYTGERLTFERAQSRCEAKDREICDFTSLRRLECGVCCSHRGMHWTNSTCNVQIKVKDDGDVALVHQPDGVSDPSLVIDHLRVDSKNFFRLFWKDGNFPSVTNDCGDNTCLRVADGCLCDTTVTETMVFDSPPARIDILNNLYIGAFHPRTYGKNVYERLKTGDKKVATYVRGGVVDINTIFCINDENGVPIYMKNMNSTVNLVGVDGSTRDFEFRNPPHFIGLVEDPEVRDIEYEIEAVLDSYHFHPNLPPFVAHLMIQRMGNSNPSPRFVEEVAGAFRMGKYVWKGSFEGLKKKFTFGTGERGDLAATFAAIVLDPESRSIQLDADPTHGSLREPILKVMGFMRSMELQPRPETPVVRLGLMDVKVGQMAHEQPSVFSFFLPEFVPPGRVATSLLVSPEANVLSSSTAIGMLNGFNALIKYGLMSCEGGFGELPLRCKSSQKFVEGRHEEAATGDLGFRVPDGFGADALVDELSTLLTSGRLSRDSKKVIKTEYKKVIAVLNDTEAALRLAQQLIVATPEFHANGVVQTRKAERKKFVRPEPTTSPYKAVVFVMLVGGADSFNMLVPHSGCEERIGKDLYGEYQQFRDFVALERASLLEIEANSEQQPCARFGLHPSLGNLTNVYNAGDATFFANVGIMNKPVTKADYEEETTVRLFTHNFMQREAKVVDPDRLVRGTGVLGRAKDSLTASGFKVGALSLDPVTEALDGRINQSPESEVVRSDRIEKYNPDPSIPGMNDIVDRDLNKATEATSGVFGEMWSANLHRYIFQNELLFDAVEDAVVETRFPPTKLGAELGAVARLIAAHEKRGKDRDVFYVSTPGYDTHNEVTRAMEGLLTELDDAIGAFVTEMKRQGRFDEVVLVQSSDFGRTFSPNSGGGTDHGWGGNYFAVGGALQGGKVMGTFPQDLTENGADTAGRGRFIPTTSWEAIWNGVVEWFGVEGEEELDTVLPNRQLFADQLLRQADLFE